MLGGSKRSPHGSRFVPPWAAASLALFGLLLAAPAALADGPSLTLAETSIDDPNNWAGEWSVTDGSMSVDVNRGLYKVQYNWSRPPESFDADGFDLMLGIAGQLGSQCESMQAMTTAGGAGFAFTPDFKVEVLLSPPPNCDKAKGASGSASRTITVKPKASLAQGETVELRIGPAYGPGVKYRYRVK
jgi:hypothetical protein